MSQVKQDFRQAPISNKLRALLVIAGKVQKGGKQVTEEEVANAKTAGASDLDIHDTVLIAAAFCMYNRYVDGLGTWAPQDLESYRSRAAVVARDGYRGIPEHIRAQTAS